MAICSLRVAPEAVIPCKAGSKAIYLPLLYVVLEPMSGIPVHIRGESHACPHYDTCRSGSRGMLPSPSPLRTVLESFPSHGSSLR
jgi:hypothetical protein